MGEDGPQSRIEQVCAVVVAYYPDECLAALIAELSPQVGAIVVVDNTPEGGAAAASTKQAALITLGNNLGIAAVHNRGIDWALFTPPRLEQVKMMSRGMWDGLRGRMGRYRGG